MIQRMYIGPTIPGIVKNGTVFIGDLPKRVADAAEEIPGIRHLMIPIDQITEAKRALSEQGSVENVSYLRILQNLKGER